MIGAIAAGVNYNRMSKKTKTMGTGEALRKAAKDPRNYLIPSGFLGAAFGDKDMYLRILLTQPGSRRGALRKNS
jgi:hypothetical protein